MIDKKYEFLLFTFLVTMFMSFIISGVLVFVNLGLIDTFITVWIKAWIKAWIVAYPSVIIIIPLVKKIVARLIKEG